MTLSGSLPLEVSGKRARNFYSREMELALPAALKPRHADIDFLPSAR